LAAKLRLPGVIGLNDATDSSEGKECESQIRLISYTIYGITGIALNWTVHILNEMVERELEALPEDMRARFAWIAQLIESHGLPNVGMPYVRSLEGKLWEMRLKGKSGISRGLYVTAVGRRVIVVRVFIKKTEKTPAAEIRLALERAKEIR